MITGRDLVRSGIDITRYHEAFVGCRLIPAERIWEAERDAEVAGAEEATFNYAGGTYVFSRVFGACFLRRPGGTYEIVKGYREIK